jgi:hypothetical protein
MFSPERAKRSVLGVALGERVALIAEARVSGGTKVVTRAGEFRYPAGMTLENGEALGAALAAHLRERGFSARAAVLGVPAKWLVSKVHVVPPADAETAATVMRMHAEAEGAPELGEIVFDFSGDVSATAASSALLAGLPRRWMDRVTAVAVGAGLKVLGITPSAAVLTGAAGAGAWSLALSVRPDEVELVARDGGSVRFLRHLGAGASPGSFIPELRRAAALVPAGPTEPAGGRALTLWDDAGLAPAVTDLIQGALGASLTKGDSSLLGGTGRGLPNGGAGGAAAALALAGLAKERLPLDFLHPRIVAPRRRRVSPRRLWITAAAATLVLGASLAYSGLADAERAAAQSRDELRQLEPAFKLAKPFVSDMDFAESFRGGGRPRFLACLRDLAAIMPPDGQAYLTNFTLRADLKGELAGRATSNQEILNLMDRLKAGGRFAGLRRRLDGRGTGAEVAFHVTFTYVPPR